MQPLVFNTVVASPHDGNVVTVRAKQEGTQSSRIPFFSSSTSFWFTVEEVRSAHGSVPCTEVQLPLCFLASCSHENLVRVLSVTPRVCPSSSLLPLPEPSFSTLCVVKEDLCDYCLQRLTTEQSAEAWRIHPQHLALVALDVLQALEFLHVQCHVVAKNVSTRRVFLDQDSGFVKLDVTEAAEHIEGDTGCYSPWTEYPFECLPPEVMSCGCLNPSTGAVVSYGFAADVWALGLLLVELAQGYLNAGDFASTAGALLNHFNSGYSINSITGTDALLSSISPLFGDFLSKCFKTDPSTRATTSELLAHDFLGNVRKYSSDERTASVHQLAAEFPSPSTPDSARAPARAAAAPSTADAATPSAAPEQKRWVIPAAMREMVEELSGSPKGSPLFPRGGGAAVFANHAQDDAPQYQRLYKEIVAPARGDAERMLRRIRAIPASAKLQRQQLLLHQENSRRQMEAAPQLYRQLDQALAALPPAALARFCESLAKSVALHVPDILDLSRVAAAAEAPEGADDSLDGEDDSVCRQAGRDYDDEVTPALYALNLGGNTAVTDASTSQRSVAQQGHMYLYNKWLSEQRRHDH